MRREVTVAAAASPHEIEGGQRCCARPRRPKCGQATAKPRAARLGTHSSARACRPGGRAAATADPHGSSQQQPCRGVPTGHVRQHARRARPDAWRGAATTGDRAHRAKMPKPVPCTNFKASTTTNPLFLTLNRLHYTQGGI
jgi:hypothetical protein